MNFVLRTAHAEEKKKGGHTNPDVRTIIYNNIWKIPYVSPMWGSLRSPNYTSNKNIHFDGCRDWLKKKGNKISDLRNL